MQHLELHAAPKVILAAPGRREQVSLVEVAALFQLALLQCTLWHPTFFCTQKQCRVHISDDGQVRYLLTLKEYTGTMFALSNSIVPE